jgi:transcriptional regulatory protein GAL4
LREVFTESQLLQLLDSDNSNVKEVASLVQHARLQAHGTFPYATAEQSANQSQSLSPDTSAFHHLLREPGNTSTNLTPVSGGPPDEASPGLSSVGTENAPMPAESVPSAEDDFEWDESDSAWKVGDGTSVVDGIYGDYQKVMDGMATLSAGDSNSGYLGTVSGAALLRTIWMGAPDGLDRDEGSWNARRQSLEHIFRKRASDDSTSAPWVRTQPNLTRLVADTLIDAYFGLYHTTFPILHEPTFREQYSQFSSRPSGSTWHIIANIVAALGSFVLSSCSDDTDSTIFAAVKGQLSIGALETGSLALVQAFGLSANYLQKRNKPNSGYNYGGVALRLAIGLGLHKEFDGWKASPLKMEIRRRVWWSLCVLDVGATITYGRPLNWPQMGVETALPLNIHEKASIPGTLSKFTTLTQFIGPHLCIRHSATRSRGGHHILLHSRTISVPPSNHENL